MTSTVRAERPAAPSNTGRRLAWVAAAVLVAVSVVVVDVEADRLLNLPTGVGRVFWRMFLENGPEWGFFGTALAAMVESIQIAWIGTIIGAIFSLPLGFFGAKNITSGLVSNLVRQVLNAIRAVPEILVAVIIFIPMVGLGAYPGALAIGLHSIGTLGKLSAEVIEGIDTGPVEAARATGGGPLQVQRWGVLPQVLPEIVAFWLYRFEINVRASAVLGVLGAGGIGEALVQSLRFARFDRAGMCVIVVIAVTILIDYVSGTVRRRIIEGPGGGEARIIPDELEEPMLADVRHGGRAKVDSDAG